MTPVAVNILFPSYLLLVPLVLASETLIIREEVGGATTMTIVMEAEGATTVAPGGVRTEAGGAGGEATDTTMEGRARGAADRAGYACVEKG